MSSGPRMAESEDGTMFAGNKENRKGGGVNERKAQGRSRIREVDFMRVEDTLHGQSLHPFELEVKEKIASQTSPLDELLRQEVEREDWRVARVAKWRLKKLLKENVLTLKQKVCYEFLYEKNLSTKEVAQRMNVSKSRVRDLRRSIKKALTHTHKKQMEAILFWKLGFPFCKTRRQRLIWRLRYLRGYTAAQIALREGRSKSSVIRVIERVTKNILNGKM